MRFLLTIIIASMLVIPVSAQWQYGGIPITDYWRTSHLSVRSDGEGGMLLAWSDYRAGSDGKAYVQRVDSSGQVLWTEHGINCCISYGSQFSPIAVTDSDGGALVAWMDVRTPDVAKIYGQRISREGNLLWPDSGLMILENEDSNHLFSDAVSDGRGGMVVQWAYPAGVQRVDTSGALFFGAEGLKLTDSTFSQSFGRLCITSDSAFIATWIDQRGVYGQKFTIDGLRLWDSLGVPIAVAPARVDWVDYRISYSPNGGLFLFWPDNAGSNGVRLQWIDRYGNARFGGIGVSISNLHCGFGVAIGTIQDGRALLAWLYYHNPPPFVGYVNLIDTLGTLEWQNNLQINVPVGSIHGVSNSISGQFEVGIETDRELQRDRIIKYDLQEGFIWGDSGVGYSNFGGGVKNTLVSDGIGGVNIGWNQSYDYFVRANRVYPNGWVVPDTTDVADDDITLPNELSISNYPNPFNSSTLITFKGLTGKEVELRIYDIEGRLVQKLITQDGQIIWTARNNDNQPLPSGLYFAKIMTPVILPALKMIYLK